MKHSQFSLSIFLFVLLVNQFCPSSALRNYDDQCSWNAKCDYSSFLICLDGRCQCENKAIMEFDSDTNLCVTKLNENCYLDEVWSREGGGGSSQSNQQQNSFGEYVLSNVKIARRSHCVANAFCEEKSHKCVCKTQSDNRGGCKSPQGSSVLHETCDYDNHRCAPNTGLKCVNGRCRCGVDYFQYFNGHQCVGRTDGPCHNATDCTPFSECVREDGRRRCKCSAGFVKNDEGRCARDHDQSCNMKDRRCNQGRNLKCVDGKCQCPDGNQVYDKYGNRCRGLVGAKCALYRGTNNFCVDHAVCSEIWHNKSFGVCRCSQGYKESGDHFCKK